MALFLNESFALFIIDIICCNINSHDDLNFYGCPMRYSLILESTPVVKFDCLR